MPGSDHFLKNEFRIPIVQVGWQLTASAAFHQPLLTCMTKVNWYMSDTEGVVLPEHMCAFSTADSNCLDTVARSVLTHPVSSNFSEYP